ncbi:putative repeat protein (TIGR01451 family) [Spirosoma oryzae]|uniref:Putative repeat protein (TIGR01451 family) n=1 Tax=Spirosoma oryzae TaxID=1469603 RepID=A0A2T0S0R9_9BACT|nr:DUF11 domain-containing protein [Spirosoma oryzae]PRY27027.1 putative repeat protein (TIGR01451 family) [Spirosoma oryzae]
MYTKILRTWLAIALLVVLCQTIAQAATPVVSYKLTRDAGGTYKVYMSSVTSYTGASARIGSAQVTLRLPTGSLSNLSQGTGSPTVTSYQNMGWSVATRVNAPSENPAFDYLSFNFSQSATPTLFDIPANQDILLFSFTDNGACPGSLALWSTSDAFQGTSTSTNPGNAMTILGAGTGNAYLANAGTATSCGAPDLTVSTGPVPPLTAGQVASVPISVSNVGTGTAVGPLSVVTTLPSGITAPSSFSTSGWGCTTSGQTVSCSSPASLSAGATSSFTLPVTPLASAVGTTPTFVATVSSSTPDSNTANNTSTPSSPSRSVSAAGACVSGTDCGTGVRYGLKLGADGITYTVYMKSATTYTGNAARVVTAQITLNVPTGTQFTNLVNLQTGMNWALNARVNSPSEAPTKDYPSFGYSQSASSSLFPITAEQEIPLFSFQLASCLGELALWSLADPFQGASTTTNPGNQMTVSGNGLSNAWSCNYTCPVGCPKPLLTLIKQAPASATQNTPFDYTFTVSNTGTGATSGPVTVTDVLPTGMVFVSGGGNGWTCSAVGQNVTCSSTTPIAISASTTFTLRVNPTTAGSQPNSATVTGGGSTTATPSIPCQACTTGPSTVTVAVQPSDLAITIQQPSVLAAGQTNPLLINVTNILSGVAAGPQSVTLTLPAGVSAPATFTATGGWGCSTTGQRVTCSTPSSLSSGNTLSLSVPITPSSTVIGQQLPFSATVAAASSETNTANNVAAIQTSGVVLGADLTVSFGQFPAMQPGQSAQVPMTISNVGQISVTGSLTLAVTLPAGVTLNATGLPIGWSLVNSTTGTGGATTVTLLYTNTGGVSPAGTVPFNLPVSIAPTASGTATFQATLTQVASESNVANNTTSATVSLGTPDLQLTLNGPSPAFEVTKPSTLSLTVTNVGTAIAPGPVTAQLVLPAGYSANQLTLTPGWSIQSSTANANGTTTLVLTNPIASLSATQGISLTVALTPSAANANVTSTISASVVAATGESNTGNNAGSLTVTPVAPKIVTTVTLPAQLTATQPNNATLVFANTGTAPYAGPLTTQITLPTSVTLGALPAGWSMTGQQTNGNGTITYTLYNPSVNLPVGGSSTVIVPIVPPGSSAGQNLPVVVTTPTLPTDPTTTTSVSVVTPVVAPAAPNVVVTIGAPSPQLSVGQTSIFPITFTNNGNAPATGPISTTISLPAGVSVLQGQLPTGWTIGSSVAGPNGSTIYTLVNPTASITANGGQLILNLPVVTSQSAAGTTPVITTTIQPTGQPSPGTATYTVSPVTAPNILLTVGQPTPALVAGQTSIIPVTIQNVGNGTAQGPLVAQVVLPAGVSLNQAQLTLPTGWVLTGSTAGSNGTTVVTLTTQNTTGFPAGSSVQLNLPVLPNASTVGTQPPFTVTVLPVQGQPTSTTQTVTPTTPVQPTPVPDLTISGSQPQPTLMVGQTSALPVSIQNMGNAAAAGPITFQISLPAALTLNTAQVPAGWVVQSQVPQANGSVVVTFVSSSLTLTPGQSTTVNVPVTPSASLTNALITMGLYVNPATGETNVGNNSGSIVTTVPVIAAPAPDLSVTVPTQSFNLTVGQPATVAFTVANVGTAATTGSLSLQFTMPAGFTTSTSTFTTNTWGCSTTANVVSCTNAAGLGIGASSSLSIPVVPTGTTGGLVNPSFQINVQPTIGETVLPNNVGIINYAGTVAAADLAVSFPAQSVTLTAGQPATITVSVTNNGPQATAVGPLSLTLAMPANFTTSSTTFTTNGWTCSTAGSVVGCVSAANLTAGSSSALLIPVLPLNGAIGYANLNFGASVAPVTGETVLANNIAYLNYPGAVLPGGVSLAIKVLLQGAYEPTTGLMQDKLRQKNLLPLNQPYGGPLGGNSTYTFINSGNETTTAAILSVTGANAIVDWVMVELHSATNPATILATRPALIQRDGDIVSALDGVSPLTFTYLTSGSYYVVVRHRNHLGVMSAQAQALSASVTTVDLTVPANLYTLPNAGTQPAYVNNAKAMLWAGNTNGDNQIIFQGPNTDIDPIFYRVMIDTANTGYVANFITSGYDVADANMDGTTIFQGPSNEVDMIFFNVIGHPDNTGVLANFIVRQHLP